MSDFVLYGAYGYTGRLIVRMAADFGLRPLLSGRNEEKLRSLSETSGYDYWACSLDNEAGLEALLAEYPLVLHAAGPFAHTAQPMHAACLATGTHYLDITGEIGAFARAARLTTQAKQAGVMLLPGVGFDVVPTDCMAAYLKGKLPAAIELTLAFAWRGGGVSQGTTKTMLEGLGRPGAIRAEGEIKPVAAAYDVRTFPFAKDWSRRAVTIPWGDVFTAYFTTGIPNIKTYFAAPNRQILMMRWSNYLSPLLRLGWVKQFLRRRVEARPPGPNDEQREKGAAFVYGEVRDTHGRQLAARLHTPEGYTLTARTALLIVGKVMAGQVQPGYQTPAGLYGPELITEVEGVGSFEDL